MNPKELLERYSPGQIMQALQLERYRRDFPAFASELLKVTSKDPTVLGLVPFKLNRAQQAMERLVSAQQKRDGWIRLCLLKSRQPGGSTWASARGYQLTALTPHTNGMIFAQDDPTSEHILNMVRRYYDNTPAPYKPAIYGRPPGGLVFLDPESPPGHKERRIGSSIFCHTARSALTGTGRTLHFVQLSECSKYLYPDTLWTNLSPAIPDMPGTQVILESTAYHSGQWFRDRYTRAKEDPDFAYQALFTPWFYDDQCRIPLSPGEKLKLTLDEKQRVERFGLTPDQIKWYRYKLKNYGDDDVAAELMKQDYPETDDEAWIDLTASVFDRRRLYGFLRGQLQPPIRVCDIMPNRRLLDNPEGALQIWEEPQPRELYDIGADVASGEGDAHDWSVASIVKRRTREQVAEWRSQDVDPIEYAQILHNLGIYYNRAQVAVETTGIGYSTNAQLHKLGYPNVYIWRYRGEAAERLTNRTGWQTSNESKTYLVSIIRHYVMNESLTIRSDTLWNEMCVFTRNTTDSGLISYGAPVGYNDDAIMAYMIAVVVGDDERVGPAFESEQERKERTREHTDPALVDTFNFSRNSLDQGLRALADMLTGV